MIPKLQNIKIERRSDISVGKQIIGIIIAVVLAFIVSATLIRMSGAEVTTSFASLFSGAFGDWRAITESLVKATPLIFTGLAVTVAFRGQVWNIGAEGQMIAGGMAAFWMATAIQGVPSWLHITIILCAAVIAGMIWGIIPGYLKVRFGAHEIFVTIMMNYIILYFLSYMLSHRWRDPMTFFQQSIRIPFSARLPLIMTGTRLHLCFLIAVVVAVLIYILLWKTPFGYEIRAMGLNPKAASFKGINLNMTMIYIMGLSGGLAGLAGASEVAGLHFRLRMEILEGYGFLGILIAVLARLNPIAVVFVAILYGGLFNGATKMQIISDVPVAIVEVIIGTMIAFVLMIDALLKYRIRSGQHTD